MSVCSVNGIEIYYEVHGIGEPLLLIAGLGSDSQSWLPVLQQLSQDYMVIIFDNRGVGRSTQDGVEISVELMADDVYELLKYLQVEKTCVLGHSLGGFIALQFALSYPDKVHSLILEATLDRSPARNSSLYAEWIRILQQQGADRAWFMEIFKAIFSSRTLENEKFLEIMLKYSVEYPYPQKTCAFIKQIEALERYNASSELADVSQRTLILCAENDVLFFPCESRDSLGKIPASSCVIINEAGHALHVEQSERFLAEVKKFLRG